MSADKSLAVFCLALLAGCATVPSQPEISWGKSGISFVDYRTDAIQCAIGAAQTDMSGETAYKEVMNGVEQQFQILENQQSLDPVNQYLMVQKRNFHHNVPELQAFLQARLTKCLRSRGYRQFALTPVQQANLAKLHKGSDARFHFLYNLARDPDVLASQAVSQPPPHS